MSCERIQSQIVWFLYNELDEQARTEVEDHVEACATCAAHLERERGFLTRLSERPVSEPSAAVLAECRHDLMRSIYRADRLRERNKIAWVQPLDIVRQFWESMGAWRRPVAATCLVAMGFMGGWSYRNTGSASGALRSMNPNELSIANISGVNLDPQAGKVQISFDEMRRQTLSGNIQDPKIQKFLIYAAMNYSNPGVRMDTIEILKDRAGEREIRDTLLYVLDHDRNPGVRLKALEGLKQYGGDAEVRRTLIKVLTSDTNPGMRVQAIDLLMQSQDHSLVEILQGVAEKEENNYVRMRCRDALRDMNASVETF